MECLFWPVIMYVNNYCRVKKLYISVVFRLLFKVVSLATTKQHALNLRLYPALPLNTALPLCPALPLTTAL